MIWYDIIQIFLRSFFDFNFDFLNGSNLLLSPVANGFKLSPSSESNELVELTSKTISSVGFTRKKLRH
ncbi:hypothetical protein DERP_003574 [Dermatophagoides pteronyssinus]|uniref:Uncharacterized protein n=1 Tax=Dermatophagoides pteronyssinus TaxID=6956 RepID=A0ABQ8JLV8_DERPT|nr:hypothetical protein DERP_003574 [Dermatophagoides pteronyssinus]